MPYPPTPLHTQSTVTIDLDGQSVRCVFHIPSSEIDTFLEAHGAHSMVVIPLFSQKKWAKWHKPTRRPNPRRIEKRVARVKKKCPDEWNQFGSIQTGQADVPPIPAVIVFDRDRLAAKAVVETAGLEHLYWVGQAAGLAAYSTKIIDDNEFSDFAAMRRHARQGFVDMFRAAKNYSSLEAGLRMVGGSPWQLRLLLGSILAVGVGACLLVAYGSGLRTFDLPAPLHPILIPFLFAGLYLRRLCVPRDPTGRQEIAAGDAKNVWRGFAPHLLAVWIAVLAGVGLLTGAATMADNSLSVSEWLEDFVVNSTIALWILTPFVYSRRLSDAIGPVIEVGITVFFGIIMLKITLFFIPQGFHLGFDILFSIFKLRVPDWLSGAVNEMVGVGGGLVFLAIMLGYGWVKAREQFLSWVPIVPGRPPGLESNNAWTIQLPTDDLESSKKPEGLPAQSNAPRDPGSRISP